MDGSNKKGGEMKQDVIHKHWGKLSYAEIAKLTGQTADAIRKMGRRLGLPPIKVNAQNRDLTPEQEIGRDVTVQALGSKVKQTTAKYSILQDRVAELTAQIEAMKVVGDDNSYTLPDGKGQKSDGVTGVIMLGDWHVAETVHGANVNGMNEFNLTIAESRIETLFHNAVRLITLFQESSQMKDVVLALLGDLINGQLREEAMENNSLRPMEEMLWVKKHLRAGIQFILDNTNVNLIIPCHSGNHARVTKKIHWSTEAGNSLEYAMYHVLASDFEGNKRVKFIIPTSYHSYVDIHGFVIRFHHGHSIKYGGGIGGIFIPAFKAVSQWQKARHADLDCFQHFHQSKDGGNFVCGGSLIGYNEYAVSIKADFEKPKQTFFLVDHARKEKTVTTNIFLD